MMKKIITLVTVALALAGCNTFDNGADKPVKPRKIAVQMWSVHDMPFDEAIAKLKTIGVEAIEAFPGQELSKSMPGVKLWPTITKEQLDFVKKTCADANIKIVSFGVANANTPAEIEQLCKFANALGVKRVMTESRVINFPVWEKMGEKYGITMCLHHHSRSSSNQFYDAELVKRYIGHYKHLKANLDIGHVTRSGFNAAESAKILGDTIGSIHVKDETAAEEWGTCVPLGKGVVGIDAVLAQLDSQGYDGYYVVEYEDEKLWGKNLPMIKECIDYLKTH